MPLIIGALVSAQGSNLTEALGVFAVGFAMCCVLSYGATVFMLLPALFVVSRFARLTAVRAGLIGLTLGLLAYVPLTLAMYFSPTMEARELSDSYWDFISTDCAVPLLICCGSGLITALAYCLLAKPAGKAEASTGGSN